MGRFTSEGEGYLAQKLAANEAVVVTHFVLANIPALDPLVLPPSSEVMPAAAAIVGEYPTTQSGFLNANQVVYSLVLDSSVGDFTFNWVGLKTDDGRLLAVEYVSPINKTRYEGVQVGNNITRNMVIEFTGAQQATNINIDAGTWQIDYSARLNQIDENQRLALRDQYGRSTFLAEGFSVVRQGASTIVKAGSSYVEGVRIELEVDHNLGNVTDRAIWLDAALVNDAGLVTGAHSFKTSAVAVNELDYSSTESHYLINLAVVNYNGVISDNRNVLANSHVYQGGAVAALKAFASKEIEDFSKVVSQMFAGQVSTFAGNKPPLGWLKSNGQELSRAEFPFLWAYASGSGNIAGQSVKSAGQFGTGNGVTTFTLPDLRGQHLRYWDDGRGLDNGRAIGTEQLDDIKQHGHGASSEESGGHSHSATTSNAGRHTHYAQSEEGGNHSHSYKQVWGSRVNNENIEMRTSDGHLHGRTDTESTGSGGVHTHDVNIHDGGAHTHGVSIGDSGLHDHVVSIEKTGIAENRVKNVALMVCIKY